MKATWLPISLVVLAAACTPPPSDTNSPPAGNTSSSNVSVATPDSDSSGDAGEAETTLVSLDIPGMTCAGCAMEVKDVLAPVPGVVDVQADPVKKIAVVSVDATKFDSQVALETLAATRFKDSSLSE